MINKTKGIINEFLLQDIMLFLLVIGETGLGKTQLIRSFQQVYVQQNGYQSMIYLHTPPTGLIKHLYHAILTASDVPALKDYSETNLWEKVQSVLMNNQVKAIVVDDVQNVLNGKNSVEFLEKMNRLADSTSTKIIFLSTKPLDMPTIMGQRSKILELQTA
jgi:chromosomal replication initiation ATPase DnaA